jgi:hypothetical protein
MLTLWLLLLPPPPWSVIVMGGSLLARLSLLGLWLLLLLLSTLYCMDCVLILRLPAAGSVSVVSGMHVRRRAWLLQVHF